MKRNKRRKNTKNSIMILVALLLLLLILPVIYFGLLTQKTGFLDYLVNVSVEIIGIVITILFVDQIISFQNRKQYKKQLIRQAKSQDNGIALQAINELKAEGWLFDGSLKHCDFSNANLENAELEGACLYGANLKGSILKNADLRSADLRSTELVSVDFRNAKLYGARLYQSILYQIDEYKNSVMFYNQFSVWELAQNARIKNPELEIKCALFNENTILPNNKKWKSNNNLDEFTERDVTIRLEPGIVKKMHSRKYKLEGEGIDIEFPSKKDFEEYIEANRDAFKK